MKGNNNNLIIRVFYALVTLAVGVLIALFVYQNATYDNAKYPFRLGLDLAGGSHLVYEADTTGVDKADVPELMNVLRDVIERRINIFGVSEPIVQVESSSFVTGDVKQRLVIELPGITDVSQAIDEIGKTPLLEFKLVSMEAAPETDANGSTTISTQATYVDTGLTGRYLESSQIQFTGQSGTGGLSNEPIVSIKFNDEGAKLFEEITKNNVGQNLAIFLDGNVVSAPRINEAISGGQAVISGNFTPDEAKALSQNLNFGALPVAIELASTETIGASLGAEVLDKSVKAGLIGLLFVVVFMTLWYRLPGVIASLSLLFYIVVVLALFQLIPVTLTAAGLAGFVLSMGIAVDANVLVFERMKEEFRSGKSMREAARIGFSRAWSAIRDGHVTSILSAIILFWFGTSVVKGFALVFGIGVLVSLLSALLIARTLLMALPDIRKGRNVWSFFYESGLGK